jgi:prepilin-type N-terminal cleavage/methylation domain-containing protein
MRSRAGFTLIEMIIFVAIFSVVMAGFAAVFTNIAGVQVAQSDQAEVRSQSQFLLQTVQYYVERSSAIDIPADNATTTLKLRMASSTEDPTIISLASGAVTLQVGGGAAQAITSNKISVSDLGFTARLNPGGHTSVAVAFTVNYAASNLAQKFSTALRTSVARVSAATFDSNIIPTTGNTYQLGASAGDWRSINNTMFFSGSNVGIGVNPAASTPLEVSGGSIYIADSGTGIILKNGSSCYLLTVTSGGGLATSSLACP